MKRFAFRIGVGIVAAGRALRLARALGNSRRSACFVGLAFLALVFPPTGPANTHEPSPGSQLFVVATLSNSVTVIDTVTNEVSARIPVGRAPYRLAMTPDGRKAYVSNLASNTISAIDTVNRVTTVTITTGYPGVQE